MLAGGPHRALHVALGVISVVLALIVLVHPAIGLAALILLLAVGLLVLGFVGITLGVFGRRYSRGARTVSLGVGVVAVILAAAAIADPVLGARTLLFLLYIALAIYGMGAIGFGTSRRAPGWVRGWLLVIGILDLVLAAVVLVFPGLGLLLLVTLFGVVLFLNGLKEIGTGFAGKMPAPVTRILSS